MARLQRNHRKRRRPPIGDLCTKVEIQNREQVPGDFGVAKATFEFTDVDANQDTVWSSVETATGKTYFDGVGTDRRITHTVTIRWMSGVSAESWVILPDGQRLDIVQVEDLEERGEFLMLSCDASGAGAQAASGQ